ncbi:MAG: hypothetical protein IAF02_01590 [Anaerolineae bacterium]|nr:hypothetical protein [Anaerolineae bacterium]
MADKILGFKLMLTYEIREELLHDYYQFVMGEYVPTLQSMGLQISEVWQTAYGNGPNRLMGFVCEEQATITAVLASENWVTLNQQLEKLVTDFNYKVIPYRGGFQL